MRKHISSPESFSVRVDSVIYSHRKTLSISITEQGKLIVRAPLNLSVKEIDRFLTSKQAWIDKHKKRAGVRKQNLQKYIDNGTIFYLGKPRYLRIVTADVSKVVVNDREIIIFCCPEIDPYSLLVKSFISCADEILLPLVEKYCRLLDVSCSKVTVTAAKTRWGSCNHRKKSVNFSWRVFMAPPEIIEYVVLHEVCHLKKPDHSKDFWDCIRQFMPEFPGYRLWLKENSFLIKFDKTVFENICVKRVNLNKKRY